VLNEDEIKLIQAIYSRQSISIQECHFTPNCDVAQGSLLSPGLFNIYVEPLYKKIEREGISDDCIMAYADDLLVVCPTLNHLQKVIKAVRRWCDKNNFKLNEIKSGIVELLPRKGPYRPMFDDKDSIEGIPFTRKYKYLGTWISNKLTMDTQLNFIKQKTNFLTTKLYPLLREVSLSFRINLWEVFLKPLFDQLIHLFLDASKSNQDRANRLFKYSFKRFTLLAKSTPNRLISFLSGYSFSTRALTIFVKDESKWKDRTGCGGYQSLLAWPCPAKCKAILPRQECKRLLTCLDPSARSISRLS